MLIDFTFSFCIFEGVLFLDDSKGIFLVWLEMDFFLDFIYKTVI